MSILLTILGSVLLVLAWVLTENFKTYIEDSSLTTLISKLVAVVVLLTLAAYAFRGGLAV